MIEPVLPSKVGIRDARAADRHRSLQCWRCCLRSTCGRGRQRCWTLAFNWLAPQTRFAPTRNMMRLERLDCRQKASMAQLECLERVFPGRSAGSAPPETPAGTVSPEMPTVTASPEVPAGSVSPDRPTGTVAKGGPTSSQKTPPGTGPPETPTAAVSPEMATATASPGAPARRVDIPAKPPDTDWIVSETTSPVDYTPLDHGGDPLNDQRARCTEHSGHSMSWTTHRTPASHGGNMARIARQRSSSRLSDRRPTRSFRLHWTMSADGKTASYKDDAVGFLQSLPEGARLKINVLDGPGPGHEATFQLAGLDAVREKIAVACKWPPTANKMSSGAR